MRIVQTRRARLREHAEAHPARLFWTFLSYQNLPGLSTHFSVFFAIFYLAGGPSAPPGAGILGGDAPLRPARFLPRGAVITSFGRPAGGVFPAPLQRREVDLRHIIPAVAQKL